MSTRRLLLTASALAVCWQLPAYAVDKSAAATATAKLTPATQTAAPATVAPAAALFSQAELDQMLAPIALYPDTVLSHVLIAATYPLEIVKATRWLAGKQGMTASEALKAAENEPWDPSVRALVAFAPLLTKMNNELDWTQRLGDAFLTQEAQVMDTVQQLREKAYAAGNLKNESQIRVERREKVIVIEPAQPEVVYVPVYDTRIVYGNWWWQQYPPVHWPAPVYPRSAFYWGSAVQVSPGFYFSTFYWPRREIVVINHYEPRPRYYRSYDIIEHRERRHWRHEPKHRRGVVYPDHYRPVLESYGLDQPRVRELNYQQRRDQGDDRPRYQQRHQQQEERRQWADERRHQYRNGQPEQYRDSQRRQDQRVNEQFGGNTDRANERNGLQLGGQPERVSTPDALQGVSSDNAVQQPQAGGVTDVTTPVQRQDNTEHRRQWQRVDDSGFSQQRERSTAVSSEPQIERPAQVEPVPQLQPQWAEPLPLAEPSPSIEPLQRVREYRREDRAEQLLRAEPQRIEPQRIEPRYEPQRIEPQRIEPRYEPQRIEPQRIEPRYEPQRIEPMRIERSEPMPQHRHAESLQQAPQVIEQAGGNQQ